MKVDYSYSEIGCTCDRCGTFIKHIYTVLDGARTLNVGSDCIQKVINVSGEGQKIVEKMAKELSKLQTKLNDYLTRDYEMLRNKYFPHCQNSTIEGITEAVEREIKFYRLTLAREEKIMENKMRKIKFRA